MAYSFESDAGDTAFRDGIRAFLDEHLPRDMADRKRTAVHTLREDFLGWQAILSKRGCTGGSNMAAPAGRPSSA